MKVELAIATTKVVNVPECLRPYFTYEKSWDEMTDAEEKKYNDWFESIDIDDVLGWKIIGCEIVE